MRVSAQPNKTNRHDTRKLSLASNAPLRPFSCSSAQPTMLRKDELFTGRPETFVAVSRGSPSFAIPRLNGEKNNDKRLEPISYRQLADHKLQAMAAGRALGKFSVMDLRLARPRRFPRRDCGSRKLSGCPEGDRLTSPTGGE